MKLLLLVATAVVLALVLARRLHRAAETFRAEMEDDIDWETAWRDVAPEERW